MRDMPAMYGLFIEASKACLYGRCGKGNMLLFRCVKLDVLAGRTTIGRNVADTKNRIEVIGQCQSGSPGTYVVRVVCAKHRKFSLRW